MKKSVGIIPYKTVDGELFFFVGHPGGWKRDYWAYLKGRMECGENEIDTAIREFKEESGVDLASYKEDLVYLGQTIQNPNKEVAAYSIDVTGKIAINPYTCRSNMCSDGITPEINRYRWMPWNVLEPVTNPRHKIFYEKIMHNYFTKHAGDRE